MMMRAVGDGSLVSLAKAKSMWYWGGGAAFEAVEVHH